MTRRYPNADPGASFSSPSPSSSKTSAAPRKPGGKGKLPKLKAPSAPKPAKTKTIAPEDVIHEPGPPEYLGIYCDKHPPARFLALARAKARRMGRDWLLSVFQRSLVSWNGMVTYTLWEGRSNSTFSGSPLRNGLGTPITEPLHAYAARARAYAHEFHEKGYGLIVSHGLSRYQGSSDAECLSRHWIYCDADEVGDWDHILHALNSLGCSHFVQRSGSHRPEKPKFHLELPLAAPIVPTGSPRNHASWQAWEHQFKTWKDAYYRTRIGWVLGLLSELGLLDLYQLSKRDHSHIGFDAKNDRLLCLNFWGCRRDQDATPPEVRFLQTELALDWELLLEHSEFQDEEPSTKRRTHPAPRLFKGVPSRPLQVDGLQGDEALVRLGEALLPSLASLSQKGGVFRSLAGALMRRGVVPEQLPDFFRALSEALDEPPTKQRERAELARLKAKDFLVGKEVAGYGMLKDEAPEVAQALDAILPPPRGSEKARLLADAGGVFAELPLNAAASAIRSAFEEAVAFEGLHVVKITEGAGKSWAASQFAEERAKKGLKTAFATYSHHMADELASRLSVPVERLRSVVAAKTDGEPDCAFHPQLKVLASGGQNPVTSLCLGLGAAEGGGNQPCPKRQTCPAFSKLGSLRKTEALVAIGVLDHMGELTAWLGNDATGLLFVDEDPGAVETVSVTLDDLDHAVGYSSRFQASDVGWRNVVLRALRAGMAGITRSPRHRVRLEQLGLHLQDPSDAELRGALPELLALGAELLRGSGWDEEAERFYGTSQPLDVLRLFADRAAFKDDHQAQRREQWAPYRSGSLARRIFSGLLDAEEAEAFERASKTHGDIARAAAAYFRFRGEKALVALEQDRRALSRLHLLRIVRWRLPVSQALAWAKNGGSVVLLDATAHPLVLNALADSHVPLTEIRVEDGAPISRALLFHSHVSRRDLVPFGFPNIEAIQRLLEPALEEVLARFPQNPVLGLVSWRPLMEALSTGWWVVEVFWKFHQAGGRVLLPENGYFGNLRGRNDWLEGGGVDAFLTLGDDRPNLGASEAVVGALGLESEFQQVYDALTAGNLSQAHGRVRAPRRERELLALHVGGVIPGSWDARIEVKGLPEGRPSFFSEEELRGALETHRGDLRGAAKALGLGWSQATGKRLQRHWEELQMSQKREEEEGLRGGYTNPLSGSLSDKGFMYPPQQQHESEQVQGGEEGENAPPEARKWRGEESLSTGGSPQLVQAASIPEPENELGLGAGVWVEADARTGELEGVAGAVSETDDELGEDEPTEELEGEGKGPGEEWKPEPWDEEYADFEDDTNEVEGEEEEEVGESEWGWEEEEEEGEFDRERWAEEGIREEEGEAWKWARPAPDPELKKLGRTGRWKRLRDWIHKQGGLVRAERNYGSRLLFDLNEMYQRRERTRLAHLETLREYKGPGYPYDDERWAKFEEPIPITEADAVLREFGVPEEDIGLLKSWSEGLKVYLKELCAAELRLVVPSRSKEPVSVMVNDLYRCDPPWFLRPRDWHFDD